MLLLVTLALVVASAVLLILGFVQDALGFIYLSMLCAGVAALALFVFARLTKRRSAALVGAGVVAGVGSPYMAGDEAPADQAGAAEEVEPTSSVAVVPPVPAPSRPEPAFTTAMAAPEEEDPWAPEDSSDDWGDEILFPIEDYDDLRVAEILPLLGQLEPDELQEVRDRELAGKARATILDRIDDRLNRRPATVAAPASITDTASLPAIEAEPEPESAAAMAPAPAPRKRAAAKAAKAIEPAPAPAQKAPAARRATRTTKAAETAPAPAPAPAKRAAAAKAAPATANPAKAAAKTANAATNSAAPAAKKAAAPAKKTVAKTTKAATRATPAKRAAKKNQ